MTHSDRPIDTLLAAGLVLLVFLLLGPVLTIPLHVPLNTNEGWNAGFDTRAVLPGAGPLYPAPGDFVFNNYPPLGFLIVGAAGRFVFGDMILAGRILALASMLAVAGLTGLIVRQLGGAVRPALAASLLLLLLACSFYRAYVAMDDPQWLAHAFMLAGLAVLLRGGTVQRRPPALWQIAAAAGLMVAGGFIKHNLVALPVAVTLWLLWLDRGVAAAWLVAAALSVALGLGLTDAAYGDMAFLDVLRHHRTVKVSRLIYAAGALAPLLPMAAIVGVLLRRRSAGNGVVLVAVFGTVALVTGIPQRLGDGVNYNAQFETLIALCVGFGLALGGSWAARPSWRGRSAGPAWLCLAAALPIIGTAPWRLPAAWHDVTDRYARQAAWQPMIARIASLPGPAGCEMPSLCIWAGKPLSVDVFNLTQSAMQGGPIAGFDAMVARRGFASFEYGPASHTHSDAVSRLGYDPVMRPFAQAYAPVASGPGGSILLAPVQSPTSGDDGPGR
ncbi:hypothetical protein [Lichenicola sp.]|uniref:hypothetical protein n=1 Tax=Lichenicola sp. TaxID=2804529 RepID=UPI003AFFA860